MRASDYDIFAYTALSHFMPDLTASTTQSLSYAHAIPMSAACRVALVRLL
jgi:hypothetical protein